MQIINHHNIFCLEMYTCILDEWISSDFWDVFGANIQTIVINNRGNKSYDFEDMAILGDKERSKTTSRCVGELMFSSDPSIPLAALGLLTTSASILFAHTDS